VKRLIQQLQNLATFPYLIINSIFILIVLGVLLYSAVFSAAENNHPIPSTLEILKEKKDISSGLSRSFSELVRGRITSARKFNKHGPRIFLFFLLQLLMRPFFSFIFMRSHQSVIWIYIDAGISIALFVLTFLPFIERFVGMAKALF
jgi:hypothetical protein